MSTAHPQRRVLIIDDVATMSTLVKVFLQGMNLEISTARDGAEGWERLTASKPDLVIADIQMPGKDGLELCADIKSDPNLKSIRVVLLSAHADEDDIRRRARLIGADELLKKPVTPDRLRTVVSTLLL